MTSFEALQISQKILATMLILQSWEFLRLRPTFDDHGIWRLNELKEDYSRLPSFIRQILIYIFRPNHFVALLLIRLLAAIALLFWSSPYLLLFLFASTLLIGIRWRGVFNGGSDYMTLILLMALSAATLLRNYRLVVLGAFYYVTVHFVASYFVAGLVKVLRPNWRSGKALKEFLQSPIYYCPTWLQSLCKNKSMTILMSWSVMLFELTFPLCLLGGPYAAVFIGLSFAFHLSNFYFLGLNRFVWSWAACYPIIWFVSN